MGTRDPDLMRRPCGRAAARDASADFVTHRKVATLGVIGTPRVAQPLSRNGLMDLTIQFPHGHRTVRYLLAQQSTQQLRLNCDADAVYATTFRALQCWAVAFYAAILTPKGPVERKGTAQLSPLDIFEVLRERNSVGYISSNQISSLNAVTTR
jgi:hypothetical protein